MLDDCNTMIVIIVSYNEVFVLNIGLYLMLKMLHNGKAVSIVCLFFMGIKLISYAFSSILFILSQFSLKSEVLQTIVLVHVIRRSI